MVAKKLLEITLTFGSLLHKVQTVDQLLYLR